MDNIFWQYLEWHFIDTPRGLIKGWVNCLKYNFNYWSVITLLRTFLSPWRRYQSGYGRGFDFKRFFETLTFNLISRILGAILRSALITCGVISEVLVFFVGLVAVWLWLVLPVLIILCIFYGFRMLF